MESIYKRFVEKALNNYPQMKKYDIATRIAYAALHADDDFQRYVLWRAAVIRARAEGDADRARAWWSNYAKSRKAAKVTGALLDHRPPRTLMSL